MIHLVANVAVFEACTPSIGLSGDTLMAESSKLHEGHCRHFIYNAHFNSYLITNLFNSVSI